MRIRISAQPIGPLRILPELPDARLAVLEGLNGIGKTLAVRLLQVCAGDPPYASGAAAWKSLCAGLGPFEVVASGLRDAGEIIWRGDSTDWTGSLSSSDVRSIFRDITIDGRSSSIEEARKVFRVDRMGGEEGLVETLADQVDRFAETMRLWTRRYADQTAGPLAALEALAGSTLRAIGDWTSADYSRLKSDLAAARQQAAAAAAAAEAARARKEAIGSALLMAQRLTEIQSRSPGLAQQLHEVDRRVEEVERERFDLQGSVRALVQQAAVATPLVRELSNARRTVENNRRNLSWSLATAARLAMSLGIEARSQAASQRTQELESELKVLQGRRTELDAAPSMRGLLDQTVPLLVSAESSGLGDQIAIDEPSTAVQLTVSQTRLGMASHRQFLEGKPPPPEARRLVEQIENIESGLIGLGQLRKALEDVNRFQRLTVRNEERAKRALAAMNPNAGGQLQELEEKRRQCDDLLLELAAERAALRERLGAIGDATDAMAIGEQLARALRDLDLTESQLSAALKQADTALQAAQLSSKETELRETEVRREIQRAESEIRRASSLFFRDEQMSWVGNGSFASDLGRASTPEQYLQVLDLVRSQASEVNDRLGSLRDQTAAVESALRSIGRELRGQPPDAREYVPELERWLGRRFTGWLNSGRVRSELFPDADGEAIVDVDRREIRWAEKGISMSRPLEAFSSGEQAFAYTRARLGMLDGQEASPANRLIVLDEFGAFIAQDRLGTLLAYLHERSDEYPHDQLLVILPLGRDYAELVKRSFGSEAEEYKKLAAEIADRKYAVRALVQ